MTTTELDPAGDIDKLRGLKADADPRTIDEMVAEDDYHDTTVLSVGERLDNGWVFVELRAGDGATFSTGLTVPQDMEVKVGDTVRLYGKALLGGMRHGWALNGTLIDWQTPWERFSDRIRWLANHDRRQRERFAQEREALDAKYEALPPPLKARIDRFRAEDPAFRVTSEGYEMTAVGDAPKIARALARKHGWTLDTDLAVTDEDVEPTDVKKAIEDFHDLDYEEQSALVPDLIDGHSGNTFAGAVRLAYALLAGVEV